MPESSSITVMEVSPRDGLQNEDTLLTTEQKLQLIDHALDAGCKRIEVTSFVHPKRVPQMADAEAVCAGLPERADVRYTGLILNDNRLSVLPSTLVNLTNLDTIYLSSNNFTIDVPSDIFEDKGKPQTFPTTLKSTNQN